MHVKFMFSKKATILTKLKLTVKILSFFVEFLENMNFTIRRMNNDFGHISDGTKEYKERRHCELFKVLFLPKMGLLGSLHLGGLNCLFLGLAVLVILVKAKLALAQVLS